MRSTPSLRRSGRALSYWLVRYKRTWRGSIASGFLSPILFLAAMGVGLGSLVDRGGASNPAIGTVGYVAYLAPGLLAATAFQVAAVEGTFPVLGAIKWMKTYHAQLATPLEVADIVAGHLLWMALRLLISSCAFLLVMVAFGTVHRVAAVLAVPAAVLTGMSMAAPVAAFAATRDSDQSFAAIYRFVVVPLFLFSGTFFPISQLPGALRPVAYLTPLWHGVALCRGIVVGHLTLAGAAAHLGFLTTLVVVGIVAAGRTYHRRLSP